jgi:putative transposase
MGRLARVIAVGVAHHVTQRGNGRRFLLESEVDRWAYLNLLRENLALHEVLLVGYCLMANHVHLIVVPADAEGLALSMKHTHGRYASYWNVIHNSRKSASSKGGSRGAWRNWRPGENFIETRFRGDR